MTVDQSADITLLQTAVQHLLRILKNKFSLWFISAFVYLPLRKVQSLKTYWEIKHAWPLKYQDITTTTESLDVYLKKSRNCCD